MSLLRPTIYDEYAPRRIKFSDLYKHATQQSSLPDSVKKTITENLQQTGFNTDRINRAIGKDEPVSIGELKKITKSIGDHVTGFSGTSGRVVNSYVQKEAIRRRNVGRIKHDVMLESRREPLSDEKTKTNLNNKSFKKLF